MLVFILWIIINGLIWYALFYYLLYAIKNTVSPYIAPLILVILTSLAFATCPFMQPTIETVLIDQGFVPDHDMMDEDMMCDQIMMPQEKE